MFACQKFRYHTEETRSFINELQDEDDWLVVMDRIDKPTLVQAGAANCQPCNMIKPLILKAVRAKAGQVEYLWIDVEEFQEIAMMLRVSSIPQILMVKKGKLIGEFKGIPADAETTINELIEKSLKED